MDLSAQPGPTRHRIVIEARDHRALKTIANGSHVNMSRPDPSRGSRAASLGILIAMVVGGCAAGAGVTGGPSASAMASHEAMPSETAMASHPAAPSAALPVFSGAFHDVDAMASGTVALFHHPDGSFVVTFEDFTIDSAAHTDVIFVMNADVTKDADIDKTAFVDLGPLTGTRGMQDYVVPASADAMAFHTIVLWDTAMQHALAAAPLR